MAISHVYLHLLVNIGNFTLLLTCSGLAISHVYLHIVVNIGTCSGQEWQFHIATDICGHLVWSRMAISH